MVKAMGKKIILTLRPIFYGLSRHLFKMMVRIKKEVCIWPYWRAMHANQRIVLTLKAPRKNESEK